MNLCLAACGLFVASTVSAQAWSEHAHSAIGEIAQVWLNPKAAETVDEILSRRSLASVAPWADDERDADSATRDWHFVDMPLDTDTYDPAKHCAPGPNGDCALAEIERLRNQLRCAPTLEEKATAIRFAVHIVGDIHQPFHTVRDNYGENEFHVGVFIGGVRCTGKCQISAEATNLHEVWDNVLLERAAWSWGETVDRIEAGWLASDEAKMPGIDGGTPVDWLIETHKLARDAFGRVPANRVLDESYYDAELPVIDRQLGLAGLRLARFLNEAYASDECPVP